MSRRPAMRMHAGFSLVELMIAMTLGLLVLGAAIAIFQSNQSTFGANEGLNRVQENARAAYALMTRDVRSTGSSACSNEARVLGTDPSSTAFRAPLSGGASELTTVSADDLSYRVEAATSTSVTLVETAPVAADVFEAGDVVMVCNGALAGFPTVAGTSGQTVTFTAALPFNPGDTEGAAPASIAIARLRSNRWYVAANPRGGSSLWVSQFGAAGNEVAEGVQGMALSYHQAAGGNPAIYVTAPSDFNYVDAVRIQMPIELNTPVKGFQGLNTVQRNIATAVSIRRRNL